MNGDLIIVERVEDDGDHVILHRPFSLVLDQGNPVAIDMVDYLPHSEATSVRMRKSNIVYDPIKPHVVIAAEYVSLLDGPRSSPVDSEDTNLAPHPGSIN